MSSDLVLISDFRNREAPLIKRHAAARGGTVAHLELGHPADSYTIRGGLSNFSVEFNNSTFSPAAFPNTSVLYLPFDVSKPPPVDSAEMSEFNAREWLATFNSFISTWCAELPRRNCLIRPDAIELQDKKLQLMSKAELTELSTLRIPKTQVGNEFDSIPSNAVVKSINAWQQIAVDAFFNTSRLSPSQGDFLKRAGSYAPVIVQEFIPHHVEWRIYMAGGRLAAIEISADLDVVDFRLLRPGRGVRARRLADMTEILPDITALCDLLDVDYCVFDVMIEDGSGEKYLCDINPVGSWSYLAKDFGLDITDFIIDYVLHDS